MDLSVHNTWTMLILPNETIHICRYKINTTSQKNIQENKLWLVVYFIILYFVINTNYIRNRLEAYKEIQTTLRKTIITKTMLAVAIRPFSWASIVLYLQATPNCAVNQKCSTQPDQSNRKKALMVMVVVAQVFKSHFFLPHLIWDKHLP